MFQYYLFAKSDLDLSIDFFVFVPMNCTYFFPTFHVLFPYFVVLFFVLFHHFFRTFSLFSPYSLQNIFLKKSKVKIFLLARAIHREYFLLPCLKKEIAIAKELDLRPLGKVIIFRDRQTNKQTDRNFLLYIDIEVEVTMNMAE